MALTLDIRELVRNTFCLASHKSASRLLVMEQMNTAVDHRDHMFVVTHVMKCHGIDAITPEECEKTTIESILSL